jgi:hypothetical protein
MYRPKTFSPWWMQSRSLGEFKLNAATFIKEWDKEVRIMLEEDAYFDETGVHYIDGRQTEFILIDAQRGGSL